MQRAGTLADAVVLHVQHHPVAPRRRPAAPPTRCAAHCRGPARRCARSRWRWDQSTHARPGPPPPARGRRRRSADGLFDDGGVGDVFTQIEQRGADAVTLAQARGGRRRLPGRGAADKAAGQRAAGGGGPHEAAGAGTARQRDGGFLEDAHGRSCAKERHCARGPGRCLERPCGPTRTPRDAAALRGPPAIPRRRTQALPAARPAPAPRPNSGRCTVCASSTPASVTAPPSRW